MTSLATPVRKPPAWPSDAWCDSLEFLREPEALFWVFVFPILLAAGLGIAFRNRPADVLPVAASTPQLAAALGTR